MSEKEPEVASSPTEETLVAPEAPAVSPVVPEHHARIHELVDAFKADTVANVSHKIPTEVHNQLHELTERLRSNLIKLFP